MIVWDQMKQVWNEELNITRTENGAATLATSGSACLDLFATIGALRSASDREVVTRFSRAYAEAPDTAMKILFFARDVRGGLGERRVFRVILRWLADGSHFASAAKNASFIPEFGRFDDLISLLGTRCEDDAIALIRDRLDADLAALRDGADVSLLAKWLPSVNASSREAVRAAKRVAKRLGMSDAEYRRALSALRARIRLVENSLRERDYTFDYEKLPSRALYKYRRAFIRNDRERYDDFLDRASKGEARLNVSTLTPYDIIAPAVIDGRLSPEERAAIDVSWNALEDFTNGEDAIVVVDGSDSMYSGRPLPAAVAMSLAIYFAERGRGAFRGKFITFSSRPQLVEIPAGDIVDRVRFCMGYNEIANTNIERVFRLILKAALRCRSPREEMPRTVYIISDMEFDSCAVSAGVTNFANARRMYAEHGLDLPRLIFWNVDSRNRQQPVEENEQGVALVSGCTPRIFSMLMGGTLSPRGYMEEIIGGERYARIAA